MTMEEENFDLESLTKALPGVEEDGAKAVQMPEGEQIVTNVESLLSMSMKARGSTKQGEGKSKLKTYCRKLSRRTNLSSEDVLIKP